MATPTEAGRLPSQPPRVGRAEQQLPHAAPQPPHVDTAARVDGLAAATIGLVPHEESPAATESDTVNIRGLKLGAKTRSFNFSVQVSGHKAPMDSEALGQLAVGCRRSLESVYEIVSKDFDKVSRKILETTGTRLSDALCDQHEELTKRLTVLDNIKSFDFKIRDGSEDLFPKAVLVVKGVDPITRKEIKTEIVLSEEYTGEVVIAQRAINTLTADFQSKEKELLRLQDIPRNIRSFETFLDTGTRRADTVRNVQAKIAQLNEEFLAASTPEGKISQLQAEMQRLRNQIAALGDKDSHKVEIVQVRKEGTQEFVSVAKVTMTVEAAAQDEEEATFEDVSMNIHNMSYLIHHSGTITSAPAIVKDIEDAAENALKSTTDDGKAFAKKVGESRQKATGHSAVGASGAGGTSQAASEFQRAQASQRLMEQMRMQQQFRQ